MKILLHEIEQRYSIGLGKELSRIGLVIHSVVSFRSALASHAFTNDEDFSKTDVIDARALFHSDSLSQHYGHYFCKLDYSTIAFFSEIERDFYILTDRQNYTPHTFRERKLYFRNLIRFWLGYLQQKDIEGVYFMYCPHATWQLVLLHACRYLGIRHAYLSHTSLNNRCLLRTSYKSLEKVPVDYLKNGDRKEIIAKIKHDLWQDFSSESLTNETVKAKNDSFVQGKTATQRSWLATAMKKLLYTTSLYTPITVLKEYVVGSRKGEPFRFAMSMDHEFTERKFRLAWQAHDRHAKALKIFYNAHTQPVDYSVPYIYFPMHLQPEMTTQPEATVFEDHLLALEVILSILPKGWQVYVKENPRQFDTSINRCSGQLFRSTEDYQAMLRHDAVSFVPLTENSEALIAKAKLTVTLTGTAGWEALRKGKPCATFGHPWYSPCRSCFTIENQQDMQDAIARAEKLTPEMVEKDVLRFISYYQDRMIVASKSSPTAVSCNTMPVEELQASHAEALHNFFTRS